MINITNRLNQIIMLVNLIYIHVKIVKKMEDPVIAVYLRLDMDDYRHPRILRF